MAVVESGPRMQEKFIKDVLLMSQLVTFCFIISGPAILRIIKIYKLIAFCVYSLHACTQPKVSNRVLLSRPHAQIFLGKIYHAAPGPIWSFNKFASFRRILILNIVSPSSKFL
ncbi:uncharacterized protein VICG_01725 [Vittaforma corneae ATCC 50505]|uniref:Uncharacterized protein n=1 Tax=Vittaforma corneae (strain ATCC 50505) TaxID=993615 RepID=L2GK62_VITCO|nr:uncharacterized protein VICG_01725 [Vittaforma corneae ATCC 50505]ELA41236.1 hypothetical protein VICG_01725 [Vittaforma corneae ATCC 50505]